MRLTLAPLSNFDIGAAVAAIAAFAALRFGALDAGGALAAFFVGTAVYGGLGGPGAIVLFGFFLTSVALSRVGKATKARRLIDIGKTGPRDGAQVLANGGVAALCALLAAFVDARYAIAFAGAFAAATGDTWATEIGTLVGSRPRSILTGKPMATGLSGGVTFAGSAAQIAGALFVAALATLLEPKAFVPVFLGGVAGALFDSVLGASVQSLRWCPQCKRACETEPHVCGANTTPLRGFAWFGNDAVNGFATLTGAAVALALFSFLR
jgi:uncharacterized protein (TIGR00297 family)